MWHLSSLSTQHAGERHHRLHHGAGTRRGGALNSAVTPPAPADRESAGRARRAAPWPVRLLPPYSLTVATLLLGWLSLAMRFYGNPDLGLGAAALASTLALVALRRAPESSLLQKESLSR